MSKPKKVALAYSGGLDTSIIIPWLKENYRCEVVAVCGNIGQGDEELEGLEEKARKTGASEVYIEDMREEFATGYLWPLVRSGAVYEHKYLLGTSIARPLLAKKQVEIALKTGCDGLSHGATGKGNDQVRFELTYKALAPHLTVIAPWREWDIVSREDAIEYAAKHNVPVTATAKKIYSRDRNLWHVSHEGGALEDPANAAPDEIWMTTRSPQEAPDTPGEVTIGFEKGNPVSVKSGASRKRWRRLAMVAWASAKKARGIVQHGQTSLPMPPPMGCTQTPGGVTDSAGRDGGSSVGPAWPTLTHGGSTRIPAALCGVAGLAPMPGLIDGSGELPPVVYGRTRRIGVLTRGSQDLTIVLQQLADAAVEPIEGRGLRLGRLACEEEITLHPDVGPAFEEALQTFTQELGCKVTDLPLKGFSRALEANWIFLAHQAAEHYKEAIEANPHFYTTSFRELVEQGSNLSPQVLSAALAFRDAFGALLLGLFRQVDALIMPTTPFLDIPIGEPEIWQPPISHAEGFFTAPFNLVPCPALSIPCGFSRYGTPIGLQLVAAPNREAVILGLARAFEQVTDWHERIPPLAYNEKE